MPRAIISPSVLASDFGQLTAECKRMIKGGAEWLHMDVMDGHFVPNITMGAPILTCVKKGIPDIFMDCHMMVAQPEKWVDDIAAAGGALYCFHLEATSDPLALINSIHAKGMKAGVAISPDTPSTAILDDVGKAADMLLVMTVYPGRGGQKFLERCVPKVAELRARFPDKDIEVDGGVGPKTIGVCADAGSNVIVAGTAIFGAENPEDVITTLKDAVNTAQARIANKQ
ncbi:ribulose-5-phosphate 3-epimerase [Punctularia strigosozonata HHB-11173 SS5]|uniref:ribulose-5-phosphate 3-epimerase n=1 Tax=Punctularia strigosozonata (strain HHB-11173) TaxID=741275 RepID=UPI0004416972|nr:ribulose-5-phosphate 3-epimerase [Punctularia strigosozonata HHB-11173 SS5]EIN14117.1 ribulose-5-phosphate 3-epimerase [Punctularia strigosozonata HHB-11173 SS5]